MLRYLIRRLILTIPVMLGVATLVFALIHLVPGDPAQAMLGEAAPQADVIKLRHSLGLDQPLLTQYRTFLVGTRARRPRDVVPLQHAGDRADPREVSEHRRAGAGGDALRDLCSRSRSAYSPRSFAGRSIDHAAMTLALAGISMPNFWLGPLLAILFAVRLGWLPVSGIGGALASRAAGGHARRALAAILARMTRASVLEELRELYVLAARARGLSRARAVVRHAFRNSLIPIVTIIGLQFGAVLTGTIITETIFAWPGIGRLLIQAISFRDYPLVQGCILFISVTYVAMNLLTDLTYGLLDPRIRFE